MCTETTGLELLFSLFQNRCSEQKMISLTHFLFSQTQYFNFILLEGESRILEITN